MLAFAIASLIPATLLAAGPPDPYRTTNVRKGGYAHRPAFEDAIQNYKFRGIRTRVDVIRQMTELNDRASDRYERQLPDSPLRKFLQKRNFLSARSPLGRKLTSDLGLRTVFVPESMDDPEEPVLPIYLSPLGPLSKQAPEMATPQETDALLLGEAGVSLTYEDLLDARIQRMADEYYQKGLDYTYSYDPVQRKRNTLLQARSYFTMCCDAQPDNPRGYLANAIVSFYNVDPRLAYRYLAEGLKRIETADDLKIDKHRFFKNADEFRAMYDKADIFARTLDEGSKSGGDVMLAFFSFLHGDLTLAMRAIDAAARNPPPEVGEAVFVFQKIIHEAVEAKDKATSAEK